MFGLEKGEEGEGLYCFNSVLIFISSRNPLCGHKKTTHLNVIVLYHSKLVHKAKSKSFSFD